MLVSDNGRTNREQERERDGERDRLWDVSVPSERLSAACTNCKDEEVHK